MAVLSTNAAPALTWSRNQIAAALAITAVVLTTLQYAGILPAWLHRLPEDWIPPFAPWLDAFFNFVKDDLGLLIFTRFLTEQLQFVLDVTANLLFGKRRWPNLGPIPWSAIAATMAVVGYYLGGWRMGLLAGGTFVWTALIGHGKSRWRRCRSSLSQPLWPL